MRFAATGNCSSNACCVQRLAVLVMIIAAIPLNDVRLAQWPSSFATDRRDGFDQRNQLRDIVPVGSGQNDGKRDALRLRDEVVLRSRASAIGGVWSCF